MLCKWVGLLLLIKSDVKDTTHEVSEGSGHRVDLSWLRGRVRTGDGLIRGGERVGCCILACRALRLDRTLLLLPLAETQEIHQIPEHV